MKRALLSLAVLAPWVQAEEPEPYAAIPLAAAPQPALSEELEPMVVTGTRTEHLLSESPVPVLLIDRQAIRRSGAATVAELLLLEAGVHVVPEVGRASRIEMQGLSSEHVLVLVNGQRINGRINGAVDLRRMKTANIRQIEIVRGPSSALYGADALAGVINILTSGPILPGEFVLRAQSYGQDFSARKGLDLGPLALELMAGASRTTPYRVADSSSSGPKDGIDSEAGYGQMLARWAAGQRLSVDIHGEYALEDQARSYGGTGGSTYDTRKRIEDWRIGLSPHWELDAADLRLNARFSRYDDQFVQELRGSDAQDSDERTVDDLWVLGLQYDRRYGAHLLTAGLEHQYEELDADRLQQSGERDRQAVYLQDEWSLHPRWRLVPGLRYDRDSQFGEAWSPKLAIAVDTGPRSQLRLSYGEGFRAPDFKQLLLRFENPAAGYRVDGNPELQPESSQSLQFSWEWTPSRAHAFSVHPFYTEAEDLIEIVPTESEGQTLIFSYRNVRQARLYGADSQWRWTPLAGLAVELQYSYLNSEDRDSGQMLSGRAPHRIGLNLGYTRGAWDYSLRSHWVDARSFAVELGNGAPTPAGEADAYTLLDLRAEWRLPHASNTGAEGWVLAAGVGNLLDAGDPQYLPIAPRSYLLEVRRDI